MDITALQLIVTALCAVMVGFSKTGVPTLGLFAAAALASVFPARESVGMMTPILITGDIIAIVYYRRAVVWKHLLTLLPWVFIGIAAGFAVLGRIDDRTLSVLIGTLVLVLIVLHLNSKRSSGSSIEEGNSIVEEQHKRRVYTRLFHGATGILAGFTTMIGNAAGSIMSVYLLSKGMNKTAFVGTTAFFFFIVNVVKVPFTAYLGLINLHSLELNMWMIPAVAAGAFAGIKALPHIPQKHFQTIILILAAIGGLNLIVSYP